MGKLDDEAKAAALSMMDAYIEGITSKTKEVNSALAGIQFANSNIPTYIEPPTKPKSYLGTMTEHALGGIFDTPHYGVFAEAGPEAFIPIDGSDNAISIWEETGNLLGAFQDSGSNGTAFYVAPPEESDESNSLSERVITLKIEGSGDIRIDGSMSKEDIVNVLVENAKGVFMEILQQDILEEGDDSYEY